MITSFKIFENDTIEPQIGDYVLTEFEGGTVSKLDNGVLIDDYIKNEIGKVVKMSGSLNFLVEYPSYLPRDLDKLNWWFKKREILHFSKDKEELKTYIDAKKYNL